MARKYEYSVPVKIILWYGAKITAAQAEMTQRDLRYAIEESVADDVIEPFLARHPQFGGSYEVHAHPKHKRRL